MDAVGGDTVTMTNVTLTHNGSTGADAGNLYLAAGGTLLRLTEFTAYVDGKDGSEGRREGTRELLEALAKELAEHS